MNRTWRSVIIIAGMVLMSGITSLGNAQVPQTVSYQGYLTDSAGNPFDTTATGPVQMIFTIFDDVTAGTSQWSETQLVTVTEGVYSVVFGANIANPLNAAFDVPYFLEVQVETAAGSGTFEMLSPRQPLTGVPYAINADMLDGKHGNEFATGLHSHHSLDAADGSPADALSVDNAGNVGIGTAAPVQKVHIEGGAGNSFVKFTNTATGSTDSDGLTVGINSAGDAFIYNRDSTYLRMGTANGTQITVRPDGNVGIGTLAPTQELTVVGSIVGTSSDTDYGVSGVNTSTGIGVYGNANMYGVYGIVKSPSGYGVYGKNGSGSGGYGGYFEGDVKTTGTLTVDGNVGIGVPAPGEKLSVAGMIESTSGGVKFPDGTTQSTSFNSALTSHAANPSAHHSKTNNASELTFGLLPSARIADSSITSTKLASNSVGTAEIIDGNVTPAKVSAGFILNLLGLEVISSTLTIGNVSSGPTSVAPSITCPAGKQAIACGFQTSQSKWHVGAAGPNQDTCYFGFTTCVYIQGGGFVCPYGQEQVYLTATCVNDSAL